MEKSEVLLRYRRITNLCVKNILRIIHYKVYSMRLYLCDLIDFFQRTAVSIQILCSMHIFARSSSEKTVSLPLLSTS